MTSVRDHGLGIAPEKLPQMFELFAQGGRSLARSKGGLGIGLTIVKKLVEVHGGRVEATSDGHGKGSEFTVRLSGAATPAGAGFQKRDPAAGATRCTRVLIVDDNEDTARGMARLLEFLGHNVRITQSGREAVETARDRRPVFVLLDIGLPGMDGYQVAARLRQEECGKDAVIIAVPGYGQDADRRRSR